MYDESNVFIFEGKKYERMYDHPEQIRYRVIFSDDDYDYVEDEELLSRLDNESYN